MRTYLTKLPPTHGNTTGIQILCLTPKRKTNVPQRNNRPKSPLGILLMADHTWKKTKQRNFFGHSYMAPTSSIYTIQKLGLGITKALTTHIRNAIKNSSPQHHRTGNTNTHSIPLVQNIDST